MIGDHQLDSNAIKMKLVFLIPCIVSVFLSSGNAGDLYSCIDRDGNIIITSSPQDGMEKCVLKYSDYGPSQPQQMPRQEEQTQQQQAQQEGQTQQPQQMPQQERQTQQLH